MERSSIENYDGYLQMKSDLNEQKSKCTQQLLEVDKELQELRAQKAISASKLHYGTISSTFAAQQNQCALHRRHTVCENR